MKEYNHYIGFREFPDEIALCINISNCPNRCPNCHSPWLWKDEGIDLTRSYIDDLIESHLDKITCVGFMGGDANPQAVAELACHVHMKFRRLKIGWYTGTDDLQNIVHRYCFDYIKTGRYVESLGPLDSQTTNQKMYMRVGEYELKDVTEKFWHHDWELK